MAINSVSWTSGHDARTISAANTNTQNYGASVSGAVTNYWYQFTLRAKGSNTIIDTGKVQAVAGAAGRTFSVQNVVMLDKLSGATRSGTSGLRALYYMQVTEWIGDPDGGGTYTGQINSSSDGIATFTVRYTSPSVSNYDLDVGGNVVVGWTRPTSSATGLRARCKVYVNNVYIFVRSGFTTQTGMSYTPSTSERNSMVSAMGGVSPRVLKGRVETGFNFASGVVYEDSSTYEGTASIVMSVIGHVWLKVSGVMQKYEVWLKATTFKRHHAYVKDTTFKESK